MTMWPLAASGGWPLARGQLHSDSVNAQRMWPYMPGAFGEGGLIRGGPLYIIFFFFFKVTAAKNSNYIHQNPPLPVFPFGVPYTK